jgi:hypothetical protein
MEGARLVLVRHREQPCHGVVAEQQPNREEALFALLVLRREIEVDSPVEIRAHDPITRDRVDGLVHAVLTFESHRDVDVVAAIEELAAIVLGRDQTAAAQCLGERREALLPVEEQQPGVSAGRDSRALERLGLEANLVVAGLEEHDDAEWMPAKDSDQQRADALVFPLVTALEVR